MSLCRRVAICVVALLLVPAGALGARQALRVQTLLHPHYRIVGHDGATTDGTYTMLWRPGAARLGTLIDERSGRRVAVRSASDCRSPVGSQLVLGDAWLAVRCTPTRVGLYSLSRHRWRSVAVQGPCGAAQVPGESCLLIAVGVHWIEYDRATTRLGDRDFFQNITTGVVRADPSTARTRPDLDAPRLARRVCAPLRNPSNGILMFDAHFVLAIHYQGSSYLKRCGTKLQLFAGQAALGVAIGPTAVIYDTGPHTPIHGISLPNLQRFEVTLPGAADDVIGVALSDAHIYVEAQTRSGAYDVWSAPASGLQIQSRSPGDAHSPQITPSTS